MPDLAPLAAFGRAEARRRRFGPLVLAENITLGLASLALGNDTATSEFKGLRLPEPGAWTEVADTSAFWIAPRQWMIAVANDADAGVERELGAALPEAAVTDQSDGWVVLEIASDAGASPIDRVLEKLVNLDPARYGPGSATRTLIEHMSVFLIRRSPTTVTVLGLRSMAGSLWHALETAIARVTEGSHSARA